MAYKRFTNFERYFNANKDAAEGEANKLYEQQRKQAEATKNATNQLSNQFAQQAGFGTHTEIQTRPQQKPRTNVGGGSAPSVGAMPQQAVAPQPQAWQPQPQLPPMTPGEQLAQAEAGAQTKYTGPSSIMDMQGWQGVADQTLKTRSELDALGSVGGIQALNDRMTGRPMTAGESMFGAGLVGSAGRGKFDKLRAEFNPQKDWDEASKKAEALAAQGTEKAKAEAAKWQAEASRLKEEAAEKEKIRQSDLEAEAAASPQWETDPNEAANSKEGKQSWDDYSKFDAGEAVYKAHRAINPIDWIADAAGIKNPIDGIAANAFSGGYHDQENNYSNKIDFGATMPPGMNSAENQKRVYESMSAKEVKDVGKMSRRDQQAWIFKRMQRLGMVGGGYGSM